MEKPDKHSNLRTSEDNKQFNIIIVEDDEGLNLLIRKQLKKEGFRVDWAENGKEALTKITGAADEVLLLDYKLPDMTGQELIEKLVANFKKVPFFIIMTGFVDEKIAVEMMKLGARDYIVKEADFIDVLIEKLKRTCSVIDKHRKLEEAEETLRKQSQLLKETGQMAKVGGWEINFKNNTVIFSEVTKIIHEVPDDFIPTIDEALNFYPHESRSVIEKVVQKAIKKGISYNLEIPFVTAKGNKIWVHAIGKPEMKGGKCIRLHGTFQDITARKQNEEQLLELNSQLSLAQNIAKLGYWTYDVKNQLPKWTDECFSMYNIPKEKGEPYFQEQKKIVHPDDWDLYESSVQKAITDDVPYNIQIRLVHHNGNIVWIRSKGFPRKNSKGEVTELFGIVLDITDFKETEIALQKAKKNAEESEVQLRVLFEKSPDFIIISNIKGEIIKCNEATLKFHNFKSLDEFQKYLTYDFYVYPKEREELVAELLKNRHLQNREVRFKSFGSQVEIDCLVSVEILKSNLDETLFISSIRDISKIKKQETKLIKAKEKAEESEYKVRNMFENTEVGIIYCNSKGEIIEANPAVLDILGSPSIEVSKKINLLSFKPLIEIGFAQNLAKCIAEKIKVTDDVLYTSKYGETVFLKYYLVPVVVSDQVTGVWVNLNNLTDQWKTQKELALAKERAEIRKEKFKMLNRLTSEMLLLPDMERIYTFIAENLQKLHPNTLVLMVSVDESIQQTRLEVVSGLDNSLLKKIIKISGFNPIGKTFKITDIHSNYFKSGNFIEFDGGLAEFSASEFPAFAANAIEKLIGLHKIYTIGINKDDGLLAAIHFFPFNKQVITDGSFIEVFVKQAGLVLQKKIDEKALKIAKEKAEESKKQFKRLIENAPDAVAITDIEGRLSYVSPNAYRHFDYSENEIIGHFGDEFTHPEDLNNVLKAIDTIIRNPDHKARVKYRFRKRNGEYRWIETTFTNLLDDETIAGIVLNFSDVTEKEQVLEELIIAKEKAEESDRLKSAFLTNMSHEIRTPMNGILGFTNLLLEPNLTGEEKQDYIDVIQKSGDRMLNTVNDIIDMSKIESGLTELSVSEVNINEQLKYYYSLFKPEAAEKGIQLLFKNDLSEQDMIIKTDLEKFNSILTNLIKNAIKYTDQGFVELGYGFTEETHGPIAETHGRASLLQFYVKDSGIGIPRDRQTAIFERFVQADIGDSRAFEGSGLGLAISKAYTEMIGGQLWVESEEGKGSIFYFTMPFQNSENNKTDNTIDESIKQTTLLNKKLKILVAEDDEVSFEHLTIILKDTANTIIHAQTGIEAVDLCRKNPDIDLVLMDIKMPQLGGYEATQRIRAFNKEVIIIAQTAFALTGDHEKSIEAGCNDYITKPIHKERLLEKIRTLLKTE